MKLLGIDYGLKKIGLAIYLGDLVEPLWVLKNSADVFKKIIRVCQEKEIERIVLGLPEGRLVPVVKKFGQKLQRLSGIPLSFQAEVLTSQTAIAKMVAVGKKRKARQEKEDAVAAALILEKYLKIDV